MFVPSYCFQFSFDFWTTFASMHFLFPLEHMALLLVNRKICRSGWFLGRSLLADISHKAAPFRDFLDLDLNGPLCTWHTVFIFLAFIRFHVALVFRWDVRWNWLQLRCWSHAFRVARVRFVIVCQLRHSLCRMKAENWKSSNMRPKAAVVVGKVGRGPKKYTDTERETSTEEVRRTELEVERNALKLPSCCEQSGYVFRLVMVIDSVTYYAHAWLCSVRHAVFTVWLRRAHMYFQS